MSAWVRPADKATVAFDDHQDDAPPIGYGAKRVGHTDSPL